MYILGVHGTLGRADHDAAAVLIRDGEIIAAAEEERFVRYKHAVGLMPDHAIRFVLAAGGISIHEVNVVAFPRATWRGFEDRFVAYLWYQFGHAPPVEYVDHHLSHAASAYLPSGFDDALIVTADQAGDGICCAVFRGHDTTIIPVESVGWPDSIGLYAAAMTQYLGGRSNHDEYKVMGLAAHGTPDRTHPVLLGSDAGRPHIDTSWLHTEVFHRHPLFHTDQLPMIAADQLPGLSPRRLPGGLHREDADLAATVQASIETTFTALVDRHRAPTDTRLCLAGGVAENSVLAGKLAASGRFTDIYVAPACGDAGTALGAALVVAAGHGFRPRRLTHTQFGPSWGEDRIGSMLTTCGIEFRRTDDPAATAAELLAQQQIVAWFQGRMEFGPRALGARSLLADPSTVEMRRRVNMIKRREQFRPFGPSVLSEYIPDLFGRRIDAPFMSFTLPTANNAPIVAATHVDGTSRPHTVNSETGLYRRLIEGFHQLTGTPAVLNTSLNSGWEPIIAAPEQAVAFLFSSPADAAVIGHHVITKKP
ncbi:carbamoyltransferase [Nocardia lijiangensis]|uniref:carbamoyltransferase family protein n=1 Tax=Nocardia lijiangensis TaxID=299618 RepID=UPI000829C989|nr:carbamoyltransferase C-terminal domain-containing protein [Nocardia lijiangensis]